jgi:hypothetical protein
VAAPLKGPRFAPFCSFLLPDGLLDDLFGLLGHKGSIARRTWRDHRPPLGVHNPHTFLGAGLVRGGASGFLAAILFLAFDHGRFSAALSWPSFRSAARGPGFFKKYLECFPHCFFLGEFTKNVRSSSGFKAVIWISRRQKTEPIAPKSLCWGTLKS